MIQRIPCKRSVEPMEYDTESQKLTLFMPPEMLEQILTAAKQDSLIDDPQHFIRLACVNYIIHRSKTIL